MSNPGIIRNRLKIYATINNANCFIELKKKENSFSKFLWSFVDGKERGKKSLRTLQGAMNFNKIILP